MSQRPTPAQTRALAWLHKHGPVRPERFDRFVAISDGAIMPSTPGLLCRLVALGWACRHPAYNGLVISDAGLAVLR